MALATAAGSSQAANFLYTGGHDLDDPSVAALGHTYTEFCQSEECWNTALSGGYGAFSAIVFGEGGSIPSEAVEVALRNYVNGGGKVIVVNDHGGNTKFVNSIFLYSTSLAYGCRADEGVAATLQAAASGTAFANGPVSVANISCTAALQTSSLPTGTKAIYTGTYDGVPEEEEKAGPSGGTTPQDEPVSTTLVWANAFGTGNVVWLGWDYCYCYGDDRAASSSPAVDVDPAIGIRDDWYLVLDAALKYTSTPPGSANLRLSFSGPSGQVRTGSQTQVYARLDNYGRNNAVNPVVHITASLPAANVVLAADPPGWLCTGDEQQDRSASSTTALPGEVDITCRMNGSMPRTTVQFKLNVMPTSSPSGFHTFSGSASSDSIDPVPDNNSASFKLYVKPGSSAAPVVPPRT